MINSGEYVQPDNEHSMKYDHKGVNAAPGFKSWNLRIVLCIRCLAQLFVGLPNEIMLVISLNAPGTPAGNCRNILNPV